MKQRLPPPPEPPPPRRITNKLMWSKNPYKPKSMTKEQRQAKHEASKLIKMYFKNLDNVYNACNEVAKAYGKKEIPLSVLKEVIKTVKNGIQKGFDAS